MRRRLNATSAGVYCSSADADAAAAADDGDSIGDTSISHVALVVSSDRGASQSEHVEIRRWPNSLRPIHQRPHHDSTAARQAAPPGARPAASLRDNGRRITQSVSSHKTSA